MTLCWIVFVGLLLFTVSTERRVEKGGEADEVEANCLLSASSFSLSLVNAFFGFNLYSRSRAAPCCRR